MLQLIRDFGKIFGGHSRHAPVYITFEECAEFDNLWKHYQDLATSTYSVDEDGEKVCVVATKQWAKRTWDILGYKNLPYALAQARKIESYIAEASGFERAIGFYCLQDLKQRAAKADSKMEILEVLDPVHKTAIAIKRGSCQEREVVSLWNNLKDGLLAHSIETAKWEIEHVLRVTPKNRLLYRQAVRAQRNVTRAQRQAARHATA